MMTFNLTPNETVFCLGAGLLIGTVYFGGLWMTVKRLTTAVSPAKTLFLSWLLRNAFLCASFYALMQGDYQRLLVAFVGVLIAKTSITTFMKRKLKQVKVKG